MLLALTAVVGVIAGALLCLAVSTATDRRRDHRDVLRRAAQAKQECYQRTLQAVDELFSMRADHPDLGTTVREITADIAELRLTAPPSVAQLADMCVQAALGTGTDPTYHSQLR